MWLGIDDLPSLIYSTSKGEIRSVSLIDLNLRDTIIPVVNRHVHTAVAIDIREKAIYYSEKSGFRIMKKSFDSQEGSVFLNKGISYVDGLAVDYGGTTSKLTKNIEGMRDLLT